MHFPLQKHYTCQTTLFFLNVIFKSAKITDFRSFTCLQNYLLSYNFFSKSNENYMFPNRILQEFLSWPYFPVLLWSSLPCLQDNERRAVSAQSTYKKQPDFISLNGCERNQLPHSPEGKSTQKEFPRVCLITHHCIQNPKRIKGDSTSTLLENWAFFP